MKLFTKVASALAISLFAGLVLAQTQPSSREMSTEEIEAIRQQASTMSQQVLGHGVVVDERGELVTDDKGSLQTEQTSADERFSRQGRIVENILGVESVTHVEGEDPDKTLHTDVVLRSSADLSCTAPVGTRVNAGQVTLRLAGCQLTNSAPSALALGLCVATHYEDQCADENFSEPRFFTVGEYHETDIGTLGIGCNSLGRCRVTVDLAQSVTVAREKLDEQAQEQAGKEGSYFSVMEKTVTSEEYKREIRETGLSGKECYDANLASLEATGKGITCDGTTLVEVENPTESGECTLESDCLQTETRTASFVRQCTRSFPLTDYTCRYELKTKTCDFTTDHRTRKSTNSCEDESLEGYVLVHSNEDEPECLLTVESPNGAICEVEKWTENWVDRNNPTRVGDCIAAPYPLDATPMASCRMGGTGVYSGCEEDGWFGRTLSANECLAVDMSDMDNVTDLTFESKAGCGICTKPVFVDSCYAKPTAGEPLDTCDWVFADGLNCTLQSSEPLSVFEGQTLSQTESYLCEKSESVCTEWQTGKNCAVKTAMSGITSPVFTSQSSLSSFNEAMVAAATITAIEQSGEPGVVIPRIFGGKTSTCSKPRGFLGGAIANDCCRINLDRPGGSRLSNKCNLDQVELAAARRSNFTHYVGQFCAKKSFGICRKVGQGYCQFDGLLPKLIQVQGRQQLADMVASGVGASVEHANLTFDYYAGQGGWSAPVTVNGVQAVAWQYPQYCADPAEAERVLSSNPAAKSCSATLDTFMALCDNPRGCGALPTQPEAGAEMWAIHPVDPLNPATVAVSRYAAASGACNTQTGQCAYRISAWPAGVGGKAMVTKDLVFALNAAEGGGESLVNIGDVLLRPFSNVGGELTARNQKLAPTVRIDYSINDGNTWTALAVPTSGTADTRVPGTDVVITGSCQTASNTCEYRAAGTVVATLKPWGSAKHPECTGFTLAQLSMLDFSRMDFNEWIVSMMGKVGTPNASQLAEAAAAQAQEFLEFFQTAGEVQVTRPQAVQTAKITPLEKFGPFEATLVVADNWPIRYPEGDERNNDPITSVQVDWGDCSMSEYLTRPSGEAGGVKLQGYLGTHIYAAADEVPVACGGGEHNIRHTVRLIVEAQRTGRHEVVLTVRNVWTRFEGTVGVDEPGGGQTTHTETVKVPNKAGF